MSRLQAKAEKDGRPKPNILYLQLVDRRRQRIRTVQGMGLPLSCETSLSHSLSSEDIQAHVANSCECNLIVGNDDVLFDQAVYDRYHHDRYVRLWIPLFPYPISRHATWPGISLQQSIAEKIEWRVCPDKTDARFRLIAEWEKGFCPSPSAVFGTLEVGYLREDLKHLMFDPFDTELADWWIATAIGRAQPLFDSTLAGALERIGRAAATLAGSRRTSLVVWRPDRRTREVREYPIAPPWPVAEPAEMEDADPSRIHAAVRFEAGPDEMPSGVLEKEVRPAVIDAVQLALRLDDFTSEPYVSVDDEQAAAESAIAWPDDWLGRFCRDLVNETGATTCVLHLFEMTRINTPTSGEALLPFEETDRGCVVNQVGRSAAWPDHDYGQQLSGSELAAISEVACKKRPDYGTLCEPHNGLERPRALLPLELPDGDVAVVSLVFNREAPIADDLKRDLEGRVVRWILRFSTRRLLVMREYSELVAGLRKKVAEARDVSLCAGGLDRMQRFSGELFERIEQVLPISGAMLTVYIPSEPKQVERFWRLRSRNQSVDQCQVFRMVDVGVPSPCRMACSEHRVLDYRADEDRRAKDTSEVAKELRTEAEFLRNARNTERASALEELAGLVDGAERNTMVVCPVLCLLPEQSEALQATLTLFLVGDHYFSHRQRRMLAGLGDIIGSAFRRCRAEDKLALRQGYSDLLDQRRDFVRNAKSVDQLIGYLLKHLGTGSPSESGLGYWNLADDAAVWILSRDCDELVLRSVRGGATEDLKPCYTIAPSQHPLLKRSTIRYRKAKDYPRMESAFGLHTFDLSKYRNETLGKAFNEFSACQWLVSFPLVGPDRALIGIVDLFVDQAPRPVELEAVTGVLQRFSWQLCAALERCRLKVTAVVARELNAGATKHLREFHPEAVMRLLVDQTRRVCRCSEVDLLIEIDGLYRLRATTREGGPSGHDEGKRYWLRPNENDSLLARAIREKKSVVRHGGGQPENHNEGVSEALSEFLAGDEQEECLAIPLKAADEDQVVGVLQLLGPMDTEELDDRGIPTGKLLKRTGMFDQEDRRLAKSLGIAIQQAVQRVHLVEQQSWLVNQLLHELGQPLSILRTKINRALVALKNTGATADVVKAFKDQVDRSFKTVHDARNQLGFIVKMIQGEAAESSERVDLTKFVDECCVDLSEHAGRKGVWWAGEGLKRGEFVIWAKPSWLRQALYNLLNNAIKYSFRSRGIELELSRTDDGMVKLAITDEGVGIPQSDNERIFDPYFRSIVQDSRHVRKGVGIGLAIVKEAIEQVHKGTVSVTSARVDGRPAGGDADAIANVPHRTVFTVVLDPDWLAPTETINEDRRDA